MKVINFEHGALIQGERNKMGVFDAMLSDFVRNTTTNADLTVLVRIKFEQINPTAGPGTYKDSDKKPVPICAWEPSAWEDWKKKFLETVQSFWSGKFWLVTPTIYNGLNYPKRNPTHRCNLFCRFEISEQRGERGAHALIPVVRVNGRHNFRSSMLLYKDMDLNEVQLSAEKKVKFITAYHEIGHLIGLGHPGLDHPDCKKGGEPACYANRNGDDTMVMGRGNRIYQEHAQPWKKAAALLTGTLENDWQVSLKRVPPRPLR